MKSITKIYLLFVFTIAYTVVSGQQSFIYNISGKLVFDHVSADQIGEIHEVVLSDKSGNEVQRVVATPDYMFEGVYAGQDYVITVEIDPSNVLFNGYTTFDVIRISNHIIAQSFIEYPFGCIAADANYNNSITHTDRLMFQQLMLNLPTVIPYLPYRYIPSNHVFPQQTNPSAIPEFPEFIRVSHLSENITDANFIAIKVGDF